MVKSSFQYNKWLFTETLTLILQEKQSSGSTESRGMDDAVQDVVKKHVADKPKAETKDSTMDVDGKGGITFEDPSHQKIWDEAGNQPAGHQPHPPAASDLADKDKAELSAPAPDPTKSGKGGAQLQGAPKVAAAIQEPHRQGQPQPVYSFLSRGS